MNATVSYANNYNYIRKQCKDGTALVVLLPCVSVQNKGRASAVFAIKPPSVQEDRGFDIDSFEAFEEFIAQGQQLLTEAREAVTD